MLYGADLEGITMIYSASIFELVSSQQKTGTIHRMTSSIYLV